MSEEEPVGLQDVGADPALATVLAICRRHPAPMAVLCGSTGTLRYNSACAALLGDRHPAATDLPWQRGWPELHHALAGQHLDGPVTGRLAVAGPAGRTVMVRCSCAPIPSADGRPVGALVVFQPVTRPGAAPGPERWDGSRGGPPSAGPTGAPNTQDNPDDLADLSSLDVGTICDALGRLIVPSRAQWAIIWLRSVDSAGRAQLDRRDVPATGRRRSARTSAPADRLEVGRVIATGSPVTVRTPAGNDVPEGPALTLPLRDKRRIVGALTLGRPTIDADDPVMLGLADRAGVAIANATRFRIEHAISRDLQRLLAPRPLPSMRGVELAARLIAGATGVTVGGDWYDGCELPDGRLALTIGDVVGHGLQSAVEMTQLRTGIRNLAMEGLSPADVLAGADEFLRRTGDARFVTCIHAVYRPDTGQLDMANAGHPRPVLLPADGRPRAVPIGTGLPLGGAAALARRAGRASVGTCRIALRPGESVLMYTDGLVESRTRTADDGMAELLRVLAQVAPVPSPRGRLRRRRAAARYAGPGARALCESVLAALHDGDEGEHDDVAVLVLRRRQQR